MVRLPAVAVLCTACVAWAGGDAGRLARKLSVQQPLVDSLGTGCHFLSVVSKHLPPGLVLSRLSYQRVPGVLELEVNDGSRDELEALLGALLEAKLCASVEVGEPPKKGTKAVKGLCRFPATAQKRTVRAVSADDGPSGPAQKADEKRVRFPDVAQADALEAATRELATKYALSELTLVAATPRTAGPVDVLGTVVHARAGSQEAFGFACDLGFAQRLTSVESMEFSAPRPEKAEWSVELTLGVQSWRYRVEDEGRDQVLETMKTAPVPAMDTFEIAPRSPFGPANLVFVGGKRTPAATDCKDDAKTATALPATEALDRWVVAYASPACLMLVDDKGACRTWKAKDSGPERFKFQGFEHGFAALKRAVTDERGEVVPQTRYLLVPERIPPAGFCK
ncbi:MAG: hypothetical protein U0228_08240 [Myxococcaceae bacterium]